MSSQTNADNSSKMKAHFVGMKSELKKVIWPTKKELINYTTVVIVMCAVVALIVWIIDSGLNKLLRLIIGN